jgi:hypothetical protein
MADSDDGDYTDPRAGLILGSSGHFIADSEPAVQERMAADGLPLIETPHVIERQNILKHNEHINLLRANNPFLKIVPLPLYVFSYYMTAGVPLTIMFPMECKLANFQWNKLGTVYLSRKGTPVIPSVSPGANTPPTNFDQGAGVFIPDPAKEYWIQELQGVDAVADVTGVVLTVAFYPEL